MRADRETPRPARVRYAAAVVGSAAALVFTSLFWPLFRHTPALPSLVAVFAVGWLCGGGPSLLTVALCMVGLDYFFVPPLHSLRIESAEGAAVLGGFLLVGAFAAFAFTRLRAGRRQQAELIEEADRAHESSSERTRETLQRLAAIVESSDDSIISKDLDGVITSWNAAAQRLFGYTAEEVLGKPISVLMPPEQRAEMALIIEKIRGGERVEHFETVRLRKNGERVPVSLTVSPIRDAAGRIVGASKIARDITERKKLEAERERLFREAQEAARVREEFLAIAGHELRTPLTTLQFQFHTLRRRLAGAEPEKAADVLQRAWSQLERLARLTEELLDVTRMTSGRFTLDLEETDLAEIAHEVAERQRDAARRAGCDIRIEARPGTIGLWDRSRLDQVMTNLLSNAVKFGNGGPIEIRVEPDTTRAHFSVRDHGIGISRENQSRIFERFERAVSRRSYGGLGLGLWISRQIVEAHGGRIEVASEPGQGSTFRVELPRHTAEGDVG